MSKKLKKRIEGLERLWDMQAAQIRKLEDALLVQKQKNLGFDARILDLVSKFRNQDEYVTDARHNHDMLEERLVSLHETTSSVFAKLSRAIGALAKRIQG